MDKRKIKYIIVWLHCIVLLALFNLNCSTLSAQPTISVGPHIGFGARMLTGNDDGDVGLGWQLGVISSIKINERLNATPSLYFSRKGYYFYSIDIIDVAGIEENQQLSYLDLYFPVAFKIKERFFFKAGLQLGVLLSANFKDNTYVFDNSFQEENGSNIKPYMHKLDYGTLAGVGYLTKKNIGFELVANWGLRNIFKSGNYEAYFDNNNYNGKNLLITAGIYYLFDINKRNSK